MMGDFCHGCLRPLPPGQHCTCPAVRAAWPAALAHSWSEVADGRSVAISVVSDLPPGSEFTLATQKPSPLSARTQAEDAIAAVLEHPEPFLALLYSQLRLRGWTDERARAALKKAGWVL